MANHQIKRWKKVSLWRLPEQLRNTLAIVGEAAPSLDPPLLVALEITLQAGLLLLQVGDLRQQVFRDAAARSLMVGSLLLQIVLLVA